MPKRKSTANKRAWDTEQQDQTNEEPEAASNWEERRVVYTRSAKDAAKEKILRCFKTKGADSRSSTTDQPRTMRDDDRHGDDASLPEELSRYAGLARSGAAAERPPHHTTTKRPRMPGEEGFKVPFLPLRKSVAEDLAEEPSTSRRRLEDASAAQTLGSMISQIRRNNEFERSLGGGGVNSRRLMPPFLSGSTGDFSLPRPFNVFQSYRQLLVEVPLGSRRNAGSNSLTDRLTSLLSSLESGPSEMCSGVLTELCQFLLLNNEDSLPNFPSRHFVTVVTKFLPPYQEDQCEDNAILACRALSCVCEVIASSVGSVARAVPCLINCLSKFNAVDVPEQALNTLELLARHNQARAILLNNGVALSLNIFDFLSSQAVLSVLTIISQCAAVVRPFPTEFKLITPFLDFAEKGLALQDPKLSLLVCRAIYRLVVNLRADASIFRRIAGNKRFVSTLSNMLLSGHWTSYPENKFLLVRSICALYAGAPALVNEMLGSESAFVEKALYSLFLDAAVSRGLQKNSIVTNSSATSSTEDELLDILTLIDVFIPPVPIESDEVDEDGVLKEEGFNDRPPSYQVVWQWKDDNNGWQTYNVTECWIIETGYFNNLDEMPLRIDNRNYAIDFDQMLQVNEETGTSRSVQRIVDNEVDASIVREHVTAERIIETLCHAVYDLSSNPASHSPLLSQRCWSLLARMVVYACERESCESELRLPELFQRFDDIGASLYSLLTSDCPLLVICALKTSYAILKCSTRAERTSWAKRLIADGIVEALQALSENEQPSRRRSARSRHMVTTLGQSQNESPRHQSSWNVNSFDGGRSGEASFSSGFRTFSRSRPSDGQSSRFSPAHSDMVCTYGPHDELAGARSFFQRTNRPSILGRQAQSGRIPATIIHKWIKSRASQILSQFRESLRKSDTKLEMLRNICDKMSGEVDEKLLCQLATALSQGVTVFQMSKSSVIKTLLSLLTESKGEETSYLLMRIRMFIDVFSRPDGDNGPSHLHALVDKLNACINFTEKFTSNNEGSVLPFSCDRSSLLQSLSSGLLVSFVEKEACENSGMIPERIGPVMCTHETKISQLCPTLQYYLGNAFNEDMSSATDTFGAQSYDQIRVELFYEGRRLEPDATVASILTDPPARSLQLQYQICEVESNDTTKDPSSSSPPRRSPLSWLLGNLLNENAIAAASFKDPSNDAVMLMRLFALLSKHQHLICHGVVDLALPDNVFVNWKLSAAALRILRDPVRLVGNEPCPRWLRCLSYDCFPLFPFELRQTAFYALNYPHSRLLNRYAELGLVNLSHNGLEHYALRMEKKRVTIKRDRILSSAEDLFSKLQPLPMLEISYENEIGHGNGPTHEFFALISKELAKADLWASNSEKSLLLGLLPSPIASRCSRTSISRTRSKFRFIGKLMAKCILDFKMLDLPLNVVVYKWLLRQEQSICLNDMSFADPDLYRQLRRLEDMALDLELGRESRSKIREYEKEIDSLCLDFTLPGYPDIELTKNGRNQPVTLDNVREFIKLVVDCRLVEGIRRQMEAMREGFQSVMKLSWLKCFHADELHMLVCGTQHDEWTPDLLTQYTKCAHGYSHSSQQVQWLFAFMCSLDRTERRLFLQFITGTPCLPVGGIKCLSPMLTIVKSTEGQCADQILPSVMTCRNFLKLPAYTNFEALQNRFRLAMSEGQECFHLS